MATLRPSSLGWKGMALWSQGDFAHAHEAVRSRDFTRKPQEPGRCLYATLKSLP